jgi:hypothetical protein
MFERCTEKARRTIFSISHSARKYSAGWVGLATSLGFRCLRFLLRMPPPQVLCRKPGQL